MRIPPSDMEDEERLLAHGESIPIKLLIGRRVMVTHGGRIGLAPEEAKPMAKVVLLPGVAVPYILRDHSSENFTFVGEW